MRLIVCGLILVVFVFPCWGPTIIVDVNGTGDFRNIQDAIDYSWDGDTVLVRPGTYNQAIKFNGRRIILTSLNPDDEDIVKSTILTYSTDPVTFDFGEGSDSVITGFTIIGYILCSQDVPATPTILKNRISNDNKFIGIQWCNGVISNNIISGCSDGIRTNKGVICNNVIVGSKGTQGQGYCGRGIILYGLNVAQQIAVVKNNIIANNDLYGLGLYTAYKPVICKNSYNCFWNNTTNYANAAPGTGDFVRDPLFAINGGWSNNVWVDGDYHLKSTAGRYDPSTETWVLDDVNSPCIDKGDPNDPIGVEPNPNGGRINIGAYGGTLQASKSPTGIVQPVCTEYPAMDFNKDCKVDSQDFAIFAQSWLQCNLDPPSACWQ